MDQLTLFAVDSHAKTYQRPVVARDWLESEAGCGGNFVGLFESVGRDGLLSKTFPACYPVAPDATLPRSFAGWSSAGIAAPGGFWMLSISEFPSDGSACSLSEVLETEAAPRFYLSPVACRGILRRAEKRGARLPQTLLEALAKVASSDLTEREASHPVT